MAYGDWQFWFVTVAALVSAISLLRPLQPARRKAHGTCRACGSAAGRQKATELTVRGRRI